MIQSQLVKQVILCLFIVVLQWSTSFGQSKENACMTLDPSPKEMGAYFSDVEKIDDFAKEGKSITATIPVYFTVIRRSDGTIDGSFPLGQSQIDNFLLNLNNNFTDIDFTFEQCGLTYIDNDVLYNDFSLGDFIRDYSYSPSAACVYFFNSTEATASGPLGAEPNNTLQFGYQFAYNPIHSTVPHEMGHFFALLHTFGTSQLFLTPPLDQSPMQVDHPYNQNFSGGAFPRELVIREYTDDVTFMDINCDYAGDMVCDTPPDGVNQAYAFPDSSDPECIDDNPLTCIDPDEGWVASICDYVGNYVDYNHHPIQPLTNNFMSYFTTPCRTEFTDGQFLRMQFYYDNYRSLELDNSVCGSLSDKVEYWGDSAFPLKNVRAIYTHPNDDRSMRTMTGIDGSFDAHIYEPTVNSELWKFGSGTDFSYVLGDWNPNGIVSVADILDITRHILHIEYLNGYGQLAADVNNSGTVSTIDIVRIRRLILQIETYPDLEAPWKFIPEYVPTNFNTDFHINPFTLFGQNNANYIFPDWQYQILNGSSDLNGFHAVLAGDVQGGDDPEELVSELAEIRESPIKTNYNIRKLERGQIIELEIKPSQYEDIASYQFGLFIDKESLEFLDVKKADLPEFTIDNFGLTKLGENEFRTLWISDSLHAYSLKEDEGLFKIQLKVLKNIEDLAHVLRLDNSILNAEFYNASKQETKPTLNFILKELSNPVNSKDISKIDFYPNPITNNEVELIFEWAGSGIGTITFYNIYGVELKKLNSTFTKGINNIMIEDLSFLTSGAIFVKVQSSNSIATGKMIYLN